MHYAILKNNVCVGVNNLPLEQSNLSEGEAQIQIEDQIADPVGLLGKTYVNGKFVETEKTAQEKQAEENLRQRLLLSNTDWKVIRHRDQLDLGIPTSLTDAEYQVLLEERQKARAAVVTIS